MTEETIQSLRKQGYRITPIREALLSVLQSVGKPASVEFLLQGLAHKKMRPNKTTIYRELVVLGEAGLVREVRIGSSRRVYEITTLGHHHHLVCTKCDSVEDVSMAHDMDRYEKKIENNTSFKIVEHSLEFFGLCVRCQ